MIASSLRTCFLGGPLTFQTLRFFCQPSTSHSIGSNVVEVCTTGYSFVTSSGRVAKYGVFWGHDDSRNVIRELPGKTHVAAMLMAMIDAVHVAREDDSLEKLVIYTDFNCPPGFHSKLKSYAMRDFHCYMGPKMKNADLLRDLYESTKDMNVAFKHRPAVENKKPNYVIARILEGEKFSLHKSKNPSICITPSHWRETRNIIRRLAPRIYDSIMQNFEKWISRRGLRLQLREMAGLSGSSARVIAWELQQPCSVPIFIHLTADLRFKSASYATIWPENRHGNNTMHRLAMIPVTLFRAQLAAIEEALKQAVDNRLSQVVVVTDSQAFMLNWRRGWLKPDGKSAANKFLCNRIRDLTQAGVEVRFRYETPQPALPQWSLALDKCVEAIDLPIVGKNRPEYNNSLAEVLLHANSLENSDVPRVRIFKRGPNFASRVVWEDGIAKDIEKSSEMARKSHHALMAVLEKASASSLRQLIIRTDSPRLVLAAENWLPIWHRSGYRNSLHKPLADADCWEKIWSLKKVVKVYWELMDPSNDSNRVAARSNIMS